MSIDCFLWAWARGFAVAFATALWVCILARVLLSWIPNVRLPLGLGELVWNVSEPILSPIRRALPFMGGLDFSPIVAYILIRLAQDAITQRLIPALTSCL